MGFFIFFSVGYWLRVSWEGYKFLVIFGFFLCGKVVFIVFSSFLKRIVSLDKIYRNSGGKG